MCLCVFEVSSAKILVIDDFLRCSAKIRKSAKGAAIFLRKTDSSMTICLRSIDDLTKLRLRERPEARSEDPCS